MAALTERFPAYCPHGHRLGARRMLVGWDNVCDPPQRIWVCVRCSAVTYRDTARLDFDLDPDHDLHTPDEV
ncbi:hypothetical protein [Williamsia sp. CHRR-6]|uniref:hypothetical protein n=1 Tax=Williamsia sp. CHRR-6 TaxID=2835871 RepID=UPI001BDA670F|nr:hypothetical protein [Williamsia sp. CHRR-6]MBT0565362.1 hypothetical protein [Williamsia sp. CHRR-6]